MKVINSNSIPDIKEAIITITFNNGDSKKIICNDEVNNLNNIHFNITGSIGFIDEYTDINPKGIKTLKFEITAPNYSIETTTTTNYSTEPNLGEN